VRPADVSEPAVWPAVSAGADAAKAFDDCADDSDKDADGAIRETGFGLNRTTIVPSTTAKDRNMKTTSCVGGLTFIVKPHTIWRKMIPF
jgi:hypothetical protein